MAKPAGESSGEVLRLDFGRRLTLQFRGSVVTSDAGLLAYRELDDALGPSAMAGEKLADARTGKNGRHALVGMLRQAVFGRLAGYEDVNDAERLRHDPAMRWIVGGKAASGFAASASQMGCFETRWLTVEEKLSALANLSGMTYRRTASGTAITNAPAIIRCSCSTSSAIWNAALCALATFTAPMDGKAF
jgi:Transposase DDE domain group 1